MLDPQSGMTEYEASLLAPLTLAYVGDSVFDLYVRVRLAARNAGGVGALHQKSVAVVNARAQAAFARGLEPDLNERERNVFMRGRNAKSATLPKNMSVADYKYATALEAVVGYLYLSDQRERLAEILSQVTLDGE